MKVIFSNIIGFDGLIFLAAVAEIFIFIRARAAAEALYKAMHKHVYAPSYQDDISSIQEGVEGLTDLKLSSLREKAVSAYTIYMNLTGIFPLLGILGTVISLIGMVGNTSDIEGNFFAALTSTFWGLIFAIAFKFMDAFISPKLDDGERAAELFMQRRPTLSNPKKRQDSAVPERPAGRERRERGESSLKPAAERRPVSQDNRNAASPKRRSRDSWQNHPELAAEEAPAVEPRQPGWPGMDMPVQPEEEDYPFFVDDSIDDTEVHA